MNPRVFPLILVVTFLSLCQLNAQTIDDALRYSAFDLGGTARSVGVNNSLGALGADFSVLSSNPAGLGMFRKSEFTITPGLFFANVNSTLENDVNGLSSEETKSNFNINNFGIVIASQPRSIRWKTFNFGIGLNRTANFNRTSFFQGESVGSLVLSFQEQANRDGTLDEFGSLVAFDAGALYNLDGFPDDQYFSDFDLQPDALVQREQLIETSGSINELVFSLAGNYNERVIIGATLGVPFLSFSQDKTYREEDPGTTDDGNVPFFESLEFRESLTTTGTGINFKLGLIFRVNQMLRFGAAFHTPTAYRLEDNFQNDMVYTFTDDGQTSTFSSESRDGLFEYRLRTPLRVMGSAGFLFGKSGFISGEIEYADYSNANFRFDGFNDLERETNGEIDRNLTSALNFRLGGEFAYEVFRFRAGLGFHESPLSGDDVVNNSYTLGAGVRERNFFVDFAYRFTSNKESYVPYAPIVSPTQFVDNDIRNNLFLLTLGFKF